MMIVSRGLAIRLAVDLQILDLHAGMSVCVGIHFA